MDFTLAASMKSLQYFLMASRPEIIGAPGGRIRRWRCKALIDLG